MSHWDHSDKLSWVFDTLLVLFIIGGILFINLAFDPYPFRE